MQRPAACTRMGLAAPDARAIPDQRRGRDLSRSRRSADDRCRHSCCRYAAGTERSRQGDAVLQFACSDSRRARERGSPDLPDHDRRSLPPTHGRRSRSDRRRAAAEADRSVAVFVRGDPAITAAPAPSDPSAPGRRRRRRWIPETRAVSRPAIQTRARDRTA